MRQIIDSTRLSEWFNPRRRDAQEVLPQLVRKLIVATVPTGSLATIRIPAGDDILLPGFDGRVETLSGNVWVPEGLSVWEMGTGDPSRKAAEDYAKRSADEQLDKLKHAFVFVTPHRWKGKDTWIQDKEAEGVWAQVGVIDSTDLDSWLEMSPPVARWLARLIGIPVNGLRDPELVLREFGASHGLDVNDDLIICGRDQKLLELEEWVRSDARRLVLEGESVDECCAFLVAASSHLPESICEGFRSRLVFASSVEAIDIHGPTPFTSFVVAETTEAARRAKALAESSIRLIVPVPRSPGRKYRGPDTSINLGAVARKAALEAMDSLGIQSQQANRAAKECKGSLTALLWMISGGPDFELGWTHGEPGLAMAPLALAGQWEADNDHDRAIVAELAGCDYEEVKRTLSSWCAPRGPLVRRGRIWDWLAWDFAWRTLVPNAAEETIARFQEVAIRVLATPDPALELPVDDRWAANIYGKQHPISGQLRSGIVASLVLCAIHGDEFRGAHGQSVADIVVRRLLGGDEWPRKEAWLSLAPWLPELAEAAPDEFLASVDELVRDADGLAALFEGGAPPFGSNPHVHLLWALERLAWSPHLLTRVTLLLGDLAAHDPGGNLSNRPVNSLKEIFLPWHPQTSATAEHRIKALRVLHQRRPHVAATVSAALLPSRATSASPTAKPEWREWAPERRRHVPRQEYSEVIEATVKSMIEWAGDEPACWHPLIKEYSNLRRSIPFLADAILDGLQHLEAIDLADEDRQGLAEALRTVLARHREFPDVDWAMSEEQLGPLDELYTKLMPADLARRHRWLFESWPSLPRDRDLGYEEDERLLREKRAEAASEVFAQDGIDGVIALAGQSARPDLVGAALGAVDIDPDPSLQICSRMLSLEPARGAYPLELQMGIGFVGAKLRRANDWPKKMLESSQVSWTANSVANLGAGLPAVSATWDLIEGWGTAAAKLYWTRTPLHFVPHAEHDGERAIRSLARVGRWFRAIDLAGMCEHRTNRDGDSIAVSTELLIEVLSNAPKHDPKQEWFPVDHGSLAYQVDALLSLLDSRGVASSVIADIEWMWLPALEHGQRGIKALQVALAEDPKLFVQALECVFKREGAATEESQIDENQRQLAQQAYRLLENWRRVPGFVGELPVEPDMGGDIVFIEGEVDREALFNWMNEARRLAAEVDRLGVCNQRIGHLLAFAPHDLDGAWPCSAVRDLIEELANKDIERGLSLGVYNKRGVHCRGESGKQERALAAKFNGYAVQAQDKWPRTADTLRKIAQGFERDANREVELEALEEFE